MFEPFKQFILRRGSIKPQYLPFYLKRVSECFTFLNESPSIRINGDQRKQFLDHMSKCHEGWQVKQAHTALRLYDYFLSREMKANAEGVPAADEDWRALEEKMREMLRLRKRSLSTEKSYLTWVCSFRAFVQEKEPSGLEGRDLQDFLSRLAVEKRVSSSTQNQALNAVVFFYRNVLGKNIENELSAARARPRRHLPVVLTMQEVQIIFEHLSGTARLMAMLIYGCGLRLHECLALCIKDLTLSRTR